MANVDTPNGFIPLRHLTGGVIRANQYFIANSEPDSFYYGDIVTLANDGEIDAYANNLNAVGVFYGVEYIEDVTGDVKFEKVWTAATDIKTGTQAKAYVYDDPNITFQIQAGNGAFAQANVGELCNVLLTAGASPYFHSKHEADMDTLAATALPLRILRLSEIPGNTALENAEIEVVINNHLFGTRQAGI
jgi:hypothetical protein